MKVYSTALRSCNLDDEALLVVISEGLCEDSASYFISTGTHSPAEILSRSGGMTRKQFARDMVAMSPDPCQGSNSTWASSNSPEIRAGRKRLSPVLVLTSDFSLARRKTSFRGVMPDSASI